MEKERILQSKEYFITYSILINAAQHQGFATYQEIAQAIGLPTAGNLMGAKIGELLGAISANEIEQHRPMLSAIAIGTNGKPGSGFAPWAKQLGLLKEGDDEETFWKEECKKIYEEWKIPYKISKA